MTRIEFPGPVLAAPMAGGAGTPALLAACGGGFLAAGYLTPDALAARIAAVRSTGAWFGVNVFAPPAATLEGDLPGYVEQLRPEFAVYDLTPVLPPAADDDHWAAKLDLLLADPVAAVSFTFGIPPAPVVAALRRAGTLVLQTVTTPAEALAAAEAGVDGLVVQASTAGGHCATLTPSLPLSRLPLPDLVAAVVAVTPLPVLAAGGLATSAAVAAALHAGAAATMVGTALLRTDEAGTSAAHRAALAAAAMVGTALPGTDEPGTSAAHRAALAAAAMMGTALPGTDEAGTSTPDRAALAAVAMMGTALPGTDEAGTSAAHRAALAAVAMMGTALRDTEEAGTSTPHRDALAAVASPTAAAAAGPVGAGPVAGGGAGAADGTVVTRAFTGRPARALRNGFIDRHDATAPHGYPRIHHLTSPLRKAAAAAGDTGRVHLWAGTGHRHAATGPAAAVIATLTAAL